MTVVGTSPDVTAPETAVVRRPLLRLGRVGGGRLVRVAWAVLLLLVIAAVLAPVLAPVDPDTAQLSDTLAGASAAHPLGADQSGRDILSRILFGTRTSLLGPLGVVVLSTLLGVLVGTVAAWRGGLVDAVLSRVLDLVFAFPGLLLAIVVVAVVGPGIVAPVLAMSVAYTPYVGRLVRSAVLQEQARPYVAAYRVQGFSGTSICLRHVLPNVAPVVLAQSTLNFGYALLDLAALSFLGLGVQPPTPDWGTMIREGQAAILEGAFLPALAPGVCIVLAVVAFNIVGEGLSDSIARREGGR